MAVTFFFSDNEVVVGFPDVSVNKNGHVSPLDLEKPGKKHGPHELSVRYVRSNFATLFP